MKPVPGQLLFIIHLVLRKELLLERCLGVGHFLLPSEVIALVHQTQVTYNQCLQVSPRSQYEGEQTEAMDYKNHQIYKSEVSKKPKIW